MENRRKCFRHMRLMFLLLVGCCFSTVLSTTTLSSNENITSEEPSATTPPVSTNSSSFLPNTNVTSDGPGGTSTVSSETTDGDLSNTSSTTRQETTTAFSDNTTSSSISTNEHLTSTFPPFNVTTTPDITTCQDISYVDTIYDSGHSNWYIYYQDNNYWYNMSFWGGHLQIPWNDNIDSSCEYGWSWSVFLFLKEKHMDIDDIGEDIITLDACLKNNTEEECLRDVEVEMRKCDGHLLYRFPWDYYNDYLYHYNTYICLDKIYTDEACESSDFVYTAGYDDGKFLNTTYYEIENGWLDAYRDGKQYVIPSFKDVEDVFENCIPKDYNYYEGYFLKEPLSQNLDEVPTRLQLYYVYKYYYGNYDYYQDYEDGYSYSEYGDAYAYARICDGRVQFEWPYNFCFIHYNNVKVTPEIGHIEESKANGETLYRPFLQFRCSFEMQSTLTYKVKWYINDTLWMETEPSSDPDDLVFNKEDLNAIPFGYRVKCGVITIGSNVTQESFSDSFDAGWKVSDTSIKLSKSGHAFVEVEQTIPLGCAHTDSGTETCEEQLSLIDPHHVEGECEASIHVLIANHSQLSYHKIKGLRRGEKWTENKKYKFKLSTIDNDYDDKLQFNMNLLLTNNMGHRPQTVLPKNTELINTVKVEVVDSTLHRNKRCYSHVDPHMRTADGIYYEQQKEGDHMLYRNEAHQTEVHEYARYCTPGSTNGPVCACGVSVRSGADVFMINRCGSFTFLDFLRCGDGGILDVERIQDYRYQVTTPIGTRIIINLLSWYNTMNIDIYLSAKDFGNTDGLCGYFDGDSKNDFRHRDGSTGSNGNDDYEFSNSWRLTNEENFLVNEDRLLDKWDQNNGAHPCSRPDSITQNKCKFQRRKRREAFNRIKKESSVYKLMRNDNQVERKKRTTYDLTKEKASAICNQSIYNAPAVLEFSDKLAGEDQDAVFNQCVYDITEGNDTAWAEAHVDALNNIAATVINLNPVFAKNNSESIKSFLQQTCLNNCTSRGSCSDAGLCTCEDIFRGPDCGIDLRIGPVINDIEGGGLCDTADGDECDCFLIRTDNIFEGFDYKLTTYEVHFDGTTKEIGHQSTHEGEYEDIFTGVVCVPEQRKKRSTDETDSSIQMYDFAISNDGTNFGQSKHVYLYDSTCIDMIDHGGIWTIVLKNNYCYIAGACVEPKTSLQTTSGCFICDSLVSPFGWVKVKCNGDEVGLATATLIAIIASSVSVVIILTAVLVYVRCIKGSKKRRAVEDIQSSQAYLSSGPSREKWVRQN